MVFRANLKWLCRGFLPCSGGAYSVSHCKEVRKRAIAVQPRRREKETGADEPYSRSITSYA